MDNPEILVNNWVIGLPGSPWEGTEIKQPNKKIQIILPDCEIFERKHFEGTHFRTSFKSSRLGENWHNTIASIIIYQGVWRFYQNADFKDPYPIDLGPGHYANLDFLGWLNSTCGSFEPIKW
ncbi:MAG: beta/gamma crystallin family protein [Blastocatellia bacterium]|nr:beta/gamma crystallin family protein [Blastocatellia bacterium]